MYGMIGTYKLNYNLCEFRHVDFAKNEFIENELNKKDFIIKQKAIGKFSSDKCFIEREDFFICIEGVVYNFKELKLDKEDNAQVICRLYLEYGIKFVKKLRGIFSIVIWDKIKNELHLLSDHTSSKAMFYFYDGKGVLFSTDLVWLIDTLSHYKKIYLSREGVYCLLSYGYMLMDVTPIKDVYKVLPGEILSFGNFGKREFKYFEYSKIYTKDDDYASILDKTEEKFTNAVRRIYEKDDEYNYDHVCTLSGGLDSRSVLFTSYDLGYKEQLTVTMAQRGTLDQTIAGEIAKDLHVENMFYSLDNGNYLKSLDRAVELNGGMVAYPGLMHSERLFHLINLDNYGAIHSGEIGDAIFGGHYENEYCQEVDVCYGAFSKILLSKVSDRLKNRSANRSKTKYLFFLLERGLNSTSNGWYSATPYTEYTSAFLDFDFLTFILSVPAKYRAKSKLYVDWMKKYHPNMCKYRWEKTNAFPTAGKFGKGIGYLKKQAKDICFHKSYKMNPYDYWMKTNKSLENYLLSYSLSVDLGDNPELEKDIKYLLSCGGFAEKTQALTLLAVIKRFKLGASFDD